MDEKPQNPAKSEDAIERIAAAEQAAGVVDQQAAGSAVAGRTEAAAKPDPEADA